MFAFAMLAVALVLHPVGLTTIMMLGLGLVGIVTTTVGVSFKVGGETISGATNTYTSDGVLAFDFVVGASTTNHELDMAVTIANIKAFGIIADQDVTIKTNSSSTPQETIALQKGKPVVWTPDNGQALPFAGNLTKMYFTNAGSVDANIKIGFAIQQEP